MGSTARFRDFGPFFNSSGVLYGAPKLYHYGAGTSTLKNAYTQRDKSVTAAQPIVGDANGVVTGFFDGLYKIVLKSNDGLTTIATWDNFDFTVPAVGESLNVKEDYGAVGDGVTDDTIAILTAIAAASANALIWFPPGTYKITSTLTVSNHRVHLMGAGPYATKLLFAPTATDTLLAMDGGGTELFQGSISDMTLFSDDSTYAKIALDIVDTSGWRIENVVIGGSVAVGGSTFWSGGAGSTGLQTRGREFGLVRNLYCYADKPIVIADNPNNTIDIDHWHFTDCYLGANGNPVVTINSGVNLSNVTFDGAQPWVLGTHGVYWNDTTTSSAAQTLTFANVRLEQGTDGTAYGFYLKHNTGFNNVRLINCAVGTDRNFGYYRKIIGLSLEDCLFSSSSKVAADVDSTVYNFSGRNNYWQAGSTATIAGQRLVWATPKYPNTGALPPSFIYDNSTNADRQLRMDVALSSSSVSIAQDATTEVGDTTALGFLFVSTDENVGALYFLHGTTNTVAEVQDPDGFFTVTAGNAGTYNIYWDAGSSRYVIQNKRTGTRQVRFNLIGAYPI